MTSNGFGPLLDAKQLADALGQEKRWVYRQGEEHGLPALKLGRSLVFDLESVRAWLASKRVGDWPAETSTTAHDERSRSTEWPQTENEAPPQSLAPTTATVASGRS